MKGKNFLESRNFKQLGYGLSALIGTTAAIPVSMKLFPAITMSDVVGTLAIGPVLSLIYSGIFGYRYFKERKVRKHIEEGIFDIATDLGVDVSKTLEHGDMDQSHPEDQVEYYVNEFKELNISREAIRHLLTQQVLRADKALNNPWMGKDVLDIAVTIPENMVNAFIKQREGQTPYYGPKVVRVLLAEMISAGKVLMPTSETVLGPRKGATFISPGDLHDLRQLIKQRAEHGPEAGMASEPPSVEKDLSQEVKTPVLDDPHGFGAAAREEVRQGDPDPELTRLIVQDLPEDCVPENAYIEELPLVPESWDTEEWTALRKAEAARTFASFLAKGGIKLSNVQAWADAAPQLITIEEARERLVVMNQKTWNLADPVRLLLALEKVTEQYEADGKAKLEIDVVKQNTPISAYLEAIQRGTNLARLPKEDFTSDTGESDIASKIKVQVVTEPVEDKSEVAPVQEKPVDPPLLDDTSFAAAKRIAETYEDELDILIGSHRKHLFASYVHDDVDLSELSNLDIRAAWRELGAKFPHIPVTNELAAYVIAFRLAYERWQLILNHEYKQELGVALSEEARSRAKGLGYNFDGFVYPKAVTERARELSDNYDTNEIEEVRGKLDTVAGEFSLGLVSTLMGMKAACEELNYTGVHDDYLRTNYVDSGNLKELMSEGLNAMRDQGLVPRNREERRASQKAARKSGKTPKANVNRKQVKKAKRK